MAAIVLLFVFHVYDVRDVCVGFVCGKVDLFGHRESALGATRFSPFGGCGRRGH